MRAKTTWGDLSELFGGGASDVVGMDYLRTGGPPGVGHDSKESNGSLITWFPKFGGAFRTALVGQASCLSFQDRQARCLSYQYRDLESSFIVSGARIRHPNYELGLLVGRRTMCRFLRALPKSYFRSLPHSAPRILPEKSDGIACLGIPLRSRHTPHPSGPLPRDSFPLPDL